MTYTTYPVGDFLIRVKNAALARRTEVTLASSKKVKAVAQLLKKEGYLTEVSEKDGVLLVKLSYHRREPRLTSLKIVSKPGLRIYGGVEDIEKKKGPSIFVISTPKGVISSREAIKGRIGGEIIAEVW